MTGTRQKRKTPPLQWSGVSRLPGLEGRIPPPDRSAVVLSTLGSLGDLYPVLSVARALQAAGIEARLALAPDDCEMARRWGLLATPVGPSEAEVCAALGMTRDEIAASVLKDPSPMISQALIPLLPEMARAMDTLCHGAGCVAATPFALGASLAAERRGLPFVPLLLQPMMTLAPSDPPYGPAYSLAIKRPGSALALVWNRAFLGAARGLLRWRHGRDLTRVRAGLGLPPEPGTPLFDHGAAVPTHLGLWSERFAKAPGDGQTPLHLTGFPRSPEGDLPDEVRQWIAQGPPPLVVTLGSIAQGLGRDDFWDEAAALARQMGLRAVLLHGSAAAPSGPDLLPLPYAAHAPLMPLAAAVVHHGGIGTTAEALRAGRPQMVLPVGGDQPDNAARLTRLGVATVLPIKRFTAARAVPLLTELLDRYDYAAATCLAEAIAGEDGAAEVARVLATVLDAHGRGDGAPR